MRHVLLRFLRLSIYLFIYLFILENFDMQSFVRGLFSHNV